LKGGIYTLSSRIADVEPRSSQLTVVIVEPCNISANRKVAQQLKNNIAVVPQHGMLLALYCAYFLDNVTMLNSYSLSHSLLCNCCQYWL